jgi:uncharacterized coiled-coil protein SlyX
LPRTSDTSDVEALQARIAELEHELAEQTRRTNAIVAEAQEKLYWLERWHVDLDRVMARPGALRALETFRWIRGQIRRLRLFKRRILGS